MAYVTPDSRPKNSGRFGFRLVRVGPKIMEYCIVVDILSSHRLVDVENESWEVDEHRSGGDEGVEYE